MLNLLVFFLHPNLLPFLAILQMSLDRALFLYVVIHDVRSSGIRSFIKKSSAYSKI